MIRFFSLCHLALALTLSTTAGASAIGTCQTGAEPECAPSASYAVRNGQGQIVGSGGLGFASHDGKFWLIETDGAINNELFQITFFNAQFNPDPFVLYALGVTNSTGGPLTYSFLLSTPYIGGPYTQGNSSFGVTAATAVGANVVLTTALPFTNLHNPDYDGTAFGALGTGCTLPAPGGNCDSGSTAAAIATGAAGSLSVAFKFTLSGNSSAAAVGTAVLGNTVPEPATVLLTACGLLALGLRRRTR